MSATNKQSQGVDGATIALLITVTTVFLVLGVVWGAVARCWASGSWPIAANNCRP